MALAALIAAYGTMTGDPDGEGLRATLPLVGRTLVEHQARQAARAGAGHIVILVERLPAALIAAIDRLRRDGLAVEIARSVADAADRIHPEEALLLIADGCIAPQTAIDRLAAGSVPALLTLADEPGRESFERIDGLTRWAGLALIDGARLRDTAAMLGEWDLQSTLLRRIVQEDAARVPLFAPEDGPRPAGLPIIAATPGSLDILERHLVAASRGRAKSWPARFLFPLAEEAALRPLLRHVSEPIWLAAGAAALALFAVPAIAIGWLWPGLLLLLLSGPVAAIADRLAAVRLSSVRHARAMRGLRAGGAGMAAIALAGRLASGGNWGWWLVGLGAVGAMGALTIERRVAQRLGAPAESPWLASPDGMIWGFLGFALAGAWAAGLASVAAYALISFTLVQLRVLDQATRP